MIRVTYLLHGEDAPRTVFVQVPTIEEAMARVQVHHLSRPTIYFITLERLEGELI